MRAMLLIVSYTFASVPVADLLDEARTPRDLSCATQLVRSVRERWAEFSPEEQSELDGLLAPRGFTLGPAQPAPQGPPAPPSGASGSCWDPQYDTVLAGDHFELQYEEGDISASTAQTFLDSLEYSWQVEVDELGWEAPDGTSAYLIPVFVDRSYTNGAYTTVQECGGGRYYPYIVIGSNSFNAMNWAKSAAAHEFNHAIQFATSFAPEGWWWEATATYIEELVYPAYNEWAPYIYYYSEQPEMAMNADDPYHVYGMAIWAFYLDEYQGGPDIIRQTWDVATNDRGYYTTTMADMMGELGLDFDAAYLDFIARNAVMDYSEHRVYPDIDTVESVSALPADGASSNKTEPEGYGQNYIKIKAGSGEGTLQATLTADNGGTWALVLAEVDDDSVLRAAVGEVEDGVGTVELEGVGDNDVYLIISPTEDTQKGQSYSWSAEIVPDAEDDGNNAKDMPEDGAFACGCSTRNADNVTPAAFASIAALAMLLRRRIHLAW